MENTTTEPKKRQRSQIKPTLEVAEAKALASVLISIIDTEHKKMDEMQTSGAIMADILEGVLAKIQSELNAIAQS